MASECSTAFLVNFVLSANATITFVSGEVSRRPGFVSIYYWSIFFTYVTGDPPATAFRLTSADGLTGTFRPNTPQIGESATTVQTGSLEGTVQVIPGVEGDITFNGTVTIIQA